MPNGETVESVGVPETHETGHPPGVMDVSGQMMILTWVTFLIVTVVLYKIAWKPILAALDKRENEIRKAQEDSARIRDELARTEELRKQALAEADAKAKEIVAGARKAATDLAQAIEVKAKSQAQQLVESAQKEIAAAGEKARAALRRESAELAIGIASRILQENLDQEKNRELADRLIREI